MHAVAPAIVLVALVFALRRSARSWFELHFSLTSARIGATAASVLAIYTVISNDPLANKCARARAGMHGVCAVRLAIADACIARMNLAFPGGHVVWAGRQDATMEEG